MKNFYYILFFVCFISKAQPYAIGHTTITFVDASRNNRNIATEIYYPANVAGNNVGVATTSELFPVLSFGHGFLMGYDAYQNFWETLVPNGYVIAFPKTEGSAFPSHTNFAKDLAFVIDEMILLNNNSSSIFYNKLSNTNCVMGHSMGGGAATLAMQYSSAITSLCTFAAAETNPSAIAVCPTITVPSLVIAGQNDCVTPPSTNQLAMYNGIASDCKTYISINGGSHCQMANSNFMCSTGEATCSPQATITRAFQHEVIFDYLIHWLDAELKANCVSGNVFDNSITSDSRITYAKNCFLCPALSTTVFEDKDLKIFPNPFIDKINVISENEIYIIVTDALGKRVFEKNNFKNLEINTTNWLSGMYFIEIFSNTKRETLKLIK